ncbi:AAA domain-containing protein [Mycobacterium sp.]|uniref:AAA domain-containing protein n=1 Tax=Mycobacterium sp. TaxID=1785 RepID=UPI0031E3E352
MVPVEQQPDGADLVHKAVNLFTFLGRAQQMLVTPVRTVDTFENVLWFGELPEHPAVHSSHRVAELEVAAPLLVVDRVPKLDPPLLPDQLELWVDGPTGDVEIEPALSEAIYTEDPDASRVELADVPQIGDAFEHWVAAWRLWAQRERRDAAARDSYRQLFEVQLASVDHSEEFELVLGVGCLTWRPMDHDQVLRHIATAPIAIDFDENTGTLTVVQVASPEAVSIELDMLDPALISSPAKIDEIRQLAGEYNGHLLDRPAIGEVCRRLVHRLDPDAAYDEDALTPPTGAGPRAAFAPAIILRRRSNRGLVQIYAEIVSQIQAAGEIPSGIVPLIDPDHQPESEPSTTPGAVVTIDEEDFLPLPVNEAQRRIIERVDRTAQTVVQGPPGTGKTHTAAVLVSHLLAQGKRVLITAYTDRALHEVRDKLPREIQPLAVSVIGRSRADMADLRTAVEQISRRADEFDAQDSQNSINGCLAALDDLRRRRADVYGRLVAIRRREVETHDDGPERGTLAAIAYRHLRDAPAFEWIRDFDVDPGRFGQLAGTPDVERWRATLLDQDVISHEAQAAGRLADLSIVVSPDEFAALRVAEERAIANRDSFRILLQDKLFQLICALPNEARDDLRARVSDVADRAAAFERRQGAWLEEALRDVRSGRQQSWVARSAQLKTLGHNAATLLARLGPTMSVVVSDGDRAVHEQVAKSLLAHLESGNTIKTLPDGTPKVGAFTSKTVKLAAPFFTAVRVDGVPAATVQQLAAFIDWVEAIRTITAMDHAWPISVSIPEEDTLAEKLQWHRTELAQLDMVLALGERLAVERAWFERIGLPVPDWNNLDEIRRYGALVDAANAADAAAAATAPLTALLSYLTAESQWPNSSVVTEELLNAVANRDLQAYVSAHSQLVHLHEVARAVSERDRSRAELDRYAPRLGEAIAADPAAPEWADRLASFDDALRWEATRRWIIEQDCEDTNVLKNQLDSIERQIRSEVENLAAERAWGYAVAPGRLTGSARANLTQYAQLVSRFGKGTGKYAAKQRAEITEAMDRCRPSVPVWIMPIYRIAEQVRVHPNLYDVVIVDEASQAGLEASFLQYLAPKVVVIGDDKQVSPAAVGVDQQHLRDLANQYLSGDPYRASWLDPKRSYFDEAAMRFGGRITLTEHRRCVPEIIGFSNRIAYEPEGIRLVPVRQLGADRLEPIKVVHLAEGYEANNKTNPVEAEAIVDQVRKCLAEPRYDGATFGVISLLGKEQAKLIEGKLLDAVAPEEWSARQLRCGDASDFQGSERDVMFLSMVKAPDPARRMSALTASLYVQRFNVAASRAKDQMWVYHSVPKAALTNKEDMRYQLLDYCYGVINRTNGGIEGSVDAVVPEDLRVPPFDSLFEQRVFNRIVERGYTVVPQYPALGYFIDLVIIGAKGRLAVECDGDFWHGPAEYEADLARQRELERCDWKFFRVRESIFYADMAGTLQKLWEQLDKLDIRTADWIDPIRGDDNVVPPEAAGIVEQALTGGRHRSAETAGSVEDAQPVHAEASAASDGGPRPADAGECADAPPVEREDPEPVTREVVCAPRPALLKAYEAFDEPLPAIGASPFSVVVANVVRIVAVEGPVLGHRLQQSYVRASGGRRVGREIAHTLNRAISIAERQGQIVSENPLNEPGVKPRTFRLPSAPQVVPRELGPRPLDEVPAAELAHHLAELARGNDLLSEEELFRAVLDRLGLKRLTDNVRIMLRRARGLVPEDNDPARRANASSP